MTVLVYIYYLSWYFCHHSDLFPTASLRILMTMMDTNVQNDTHANQLVSFANNCP